LPSLIIDSLFIITKTSSIRYHTNEPGILFLLFQNLQERVYNSKQKKKSLSSKSRKKAGERDSITQNTDSPEHNTPKEQTKKGTHTHI